MKLNIIVKKQRNREYQPNVRENKVNNLFNRMKAQ